MKKRQIITVVLVLGIIGGSIGLMGLFSGMKELPKQKPVVENSKQVKTKKVIYSEVSTSIEGFGRTSSSLPIDVIAEVKGSIQKGNVPLKEGQRFRKGDLLFKIDDTEAKLRLKSKKSTFMKKIATILPDFKIDFSESFDQWQHYFETMDLEKPLAALPQHKNNKEKTYLATKDIYTDFYDIRSEEFNLSKHHIYAPFSGTITEVASYTGTFVNTGGKVANIIETNNLELKVAIPVTEIDWITKGKIISMTNKNATKTWKGKVQRIGDFVNENTQAIDVFVQLLPGQDKVYEGMYLKAEMPGETIKKGMEIPRNAIFNNSQVYTVQDSLLKVQNVTIHKINAETVVFSGLEEGSEVVIEPLINAYNNMKVSINREKIDVESAVSSL